MSIYQVLSFHIKAFKNERDGVRVDVRGPDDMYEHIGPNTISQTIEEILMKHNLTADDIININADYTKERDIGSWDFWMFCRNPNRRRADA